VNPDEPTSPEEMWLLRELEILINAAAELAQQEMLDDFEEKQLQPFLRRALLLLGRINGLAEIRLAAGKAPLTRVNTELAMKLIDQHQRLREALEQIYEL
jgi:hypothetical protein